MDSRAGGQGNPFDRAYYADPNVLSEFIVIFVLFLLPSLLSYAIHKLLYCFIVFTGEIKMK